MEFEPFEEAQACTHYLHVHKTTINMGTQTYHLRHARRRSSIARELLKLASSDKL